MAASGALQPVADHAADGRRCPTPAVGPGRLERLNRVGSRHSAVSISTKVTQGRHAQPGHAAVLGQESLVLARHSLATARLGGRHPIRFRMRHAGSPSAALRDRALRDGRSAPQLFGLALGEASLTADYLASERLAPPVSSNDAARKPRALKGPFWMLIGVPIRCRLTIRRYRR